MADAEDNVPPLNAPVTQGPLPPVGLGPQANEPAGIRYGRGTPAYPRDTALPLSSGSQGYHPMQPPDAAGTPGYHGVPGAIPPGPAGSAEQDAIRQDAMRRPPPSAVQAGPGLADPRVTGSTQVGDPRTMAAFPPEVRPEAGSKKE